MTDRRTLTRRSFLVGGLATVAGAGAASWWALDRFVVPHVEVSDVSAAEDDAGTSSSAGATATVDDTSATSDAASVQIRTVSTGSGDDTITYHVAEVTLEDPTALRSAFAQDQFGENITQKVSEIAEAHGAVFAVNGDYYGFRDTGIEIRNGVAYRDEGAREGLALYRDGTARVYDETATTAQELVDAGVWNTLSFGPALLSDGAVIDGIDEVEVDTNFGNHSIQGEQPRTAIGVVDSSHLLFVVVDGRDRGYSRGATLPELAEILRDLGAQTAYNLDGGGSSEMWFDGEVVNRPSNGGERATSDILYIGGAS
ncbi:phosphodiester glycosidase family protein [Microbacterium marinilacus]|uniref:Phosphodiester glycosidase family protein n=1 Tax=Microbacterium marinilacus TaxID=415209 RepID=A0ABP7BDK3_9MICO|nr:phosphodiester glycosidase family protein [Microbacterium marinilacus]MBY0689356.1 phosphodiester glycosidase family protein [Microbacterium marinilacus]